MSKRLIEITICDICKKEVPTTSINYPVIFRTEQQEGRSCEPYIQQTNLDVCDSCLKKITNITADGAMGFNNYHIGE